MHYEITVFSGELNNNKNEVNFNLKITYNDNLQCLVDIRTACTPQT